MAGIVTRQTMRVLPKCPFGLARQLSSSKVLQNKNILKSDFADVNIPDVTVHEYLFDRIARYGKKVAFECNITGRAYTYDDIIKKSRNFGRALRQKLKLQRDDVVAILMPNVPEYQIAVLGIMSSGNRVTTINPIYTPGEINKQLIDADAKAVITLSELFPNAKAALVDSDKVSIPIITVNNQTGSTTPPGAINFDEFANSNISIDDIKDINPRECVFMPYSSGTTGLPKGVRLSHRNLITNLMQINSEGFTMFKETNDHFQDIVPAVLPMFHIYGFTTISCASMSLGCKVLTMTHFAPDIYAKMLIEKKPTILVTVPPIIIFLYAHPMVTAKHLETVRTVISGAAPLGALDAEKLIAKTGRSSMNVVQGYGLTESSPAVIIHPNKPGTPLASAGKLLPSTYGKIMPVDDPTGEALGPNEKGELYVKGEQIMLGYHNRPKETENTLIDGWLRTGDMFYYDENRHFFATDRIKELIKVKGFQVPPAELEEIIRDYPDVSDAAVIGIPHKISGEVPRAYVVAKANAKLDVDKLHEFINKQVAEYKQVEGGIEVVQSIPKNPSGKILRRLLKTQYEESNK